MEQYEIKKFDFLMEKWILAVEVYGRILWFSLLPINEIFSFSINYDWFAGRITMFRIGVFEIGYRPIPNKDEIQNETIYRGD